MTNALSQRNISNFKRWDRNGCFLPRANFNVVSEISSKSVVCQIVHSDDADWVSEWNDLPMMYHLDSTDCKTVKYFHVVQIVTGWHLLSILVYLCLSQSQVNAAILRSYHLIRKLIWSCSHWFADSWFLILFSVRSAHLFSELHFHPCGLSGRSSNLSKSLSSNFH